MLTASTWPSHRRNAPLLLYQAGTLPARPPVRGPARRGNLPQRPTRPSSRRRSRHPQRPPGLAGAIPTTSGCSRELTVHCRADAGRGERIFTTDYRPLCRSGRATRTAVRLDRHRFLHLPSWIRRCNYVESNAIQSMVENSPRCAGRQPVRDRRSRHSDARSCARRHSWWARRRTWRTNPPMVGERHRRRRLQPVPAGDTGIAGGLRRPRRSGVAVARRLQDQLSRGHAARKTVPGRPPFCAVHLYAPGRRVSAVGGDEDRVGSL